jgi:hypothetical protein
MQWTPEQDATLVDLHRKHVGNMFIATWMRVNITEVRARLAALGLTKSAAAKAALSLAKTARQVVAVRAGMKAAVASAAASEIAVERDTLEAVALMDGDMDDDLEDDVELVKLPGCPRGHLVSEAHINALYEKAGGRY